MRRQTVIGIYLFASILVAGSYGMVLMLPIRVFELGGNARSVGELQLVIGVIAIITILATGYVSDRLGQVRTLGGSSFLIAIGLMLWAESKNLGFTPILASIVYGVGWGLFFSLKLAVLARITTSDARFVIYSYLAVAIMLGFGLWPVWGAIVTRISGEVSTAFVISAVLCIVGGILFQILRRPISNYTQEATPVKDAMSVSNFIAVIKSEACSPIVLTFLTACIFSGMNSYQTVLAENRGLNYAHYFAVYTASAVAFRLLIVRYVRPGTAWRSVSLLYATMTLGVLLFLVSGANQLLYIFVGLLFGLGYGVSSPVVQTLGANQALPWLTAQSLQLLVLCHFAGVFGFPLIAGEILVGAGDFYLVLLLVVISVIALAGAVINTVRKHSYA